MKWLLSRLGLRPKALVGPEPTPEVLSQLEILVSSGLQRSIRVKVDHIAQFIIQTR